MTAVSEGKSRDVPSRRFAGRREGRRVKRSGERERRETSLPVDPDDSTSPRTRLSCETKRATDPRRGRGRGRGMGTPQMEKKEPGLYFPLTSERKRRSWSTRSSTNCLRGTGLGINLLLAPLYFYPPPSFSAFSLFSRLSSSLFQTLPDVTRRSDEVIVQRYEKNLVEFRFAVTNASC